MATEILFIDARVEDAAILAGGSRPDVEVVLLGGGEGGLAQIAAHLDGRIGLGAIHVLSHGSAGTLVLGSETISAGTLEADAESLSAIGRSLADGGDLLLYGCNVGAGDSGTALLAALAHWTGADVAASTGLTGSAALGGDWVLEASVGAVETAVAVDAGAQAVYASVLVNAKPVGIASGGFDSGFSGDGIVVTPIRAADDEVGGIALQSNGKIVVAGVGRGANDDFAVARYNTNGSLDTTFSSDGKATTNFSGGGDIGRAVAIQSDGKIVVAGSSGNDFAVVRYKANGALDTTFDSDGKVTTDLDAFPITVGQGNALAIQADGKIVVAGGSGDFKYALVRYNANGSLDTTFNTDGKIVDDFGSTSSINAIALQNNGNILVAGYGFNSAAGPLGSFDLAVGRYIGSNGTRDNTFGGDGIVFVHLPGDFDVVNAIAVQGDGKILLAGQTGNDDIDDILDIYDIALVRLNANGSVDTSFGGGDGIVITDLSNFDVAHSVAVQADGKILVGGENNLGLGEAMVLRYNANGSLDTGFDGDGVRSFNYALGTSTVEGIALTPDGRVVAAGNSFDGVSFDFGVVRLAAGVSDQSAEAGSLFSYQIAADAFFDPNNDTLTYSAKLASGAALPAWLSFNAATRTFSGTPGDGAFGAFQVKVTANDGHGGSVAEIFTLDTSASFIDAIRYTSDARWNSAGLHGTPAALTFSFMTGVPGYASVEDADGFTVFTEPQKVAAAEVLGKYSQYANLTFSEVADDGSGGQIRFGNNDQHGASNGYAYGPGFDGSNGDVYIDNEIPDGLESPPNYDPQPGDFSYQTLIHELGHALGFKHPGFFQSDDLPPFLPTEVENNQYTVMSYNEAPRHIFTHVTVDDSSFNYAYEFIYPDTPMLYDVAAIQYLYGANMGWHADNDTYAYAPGTPFYETLWDAGGTDTLDASAFILDCSIDLRAGHFSSLHMQHYDVLPDGVPEPDFEADSYDGTDNLAIAFGAVIENAMGGAGDDTLTGNDAANQLDGGAGADRMLGGKGNDTYIVTSGDTVVEQSGAAFGSDTVQARFSYVLGPNLEKLTLTGSGAINGTGNGAANTITGNGGKNTLNGSNGNDALNGGLGNDVLKGGAGADSLNGGGGTDTLDWDAADTTVDGGGGNADVLRVLGAGQTLNLTAVSNMLIKGIERINLTGSGNNTLVLGMNDLIDLSSPTDQLIVLGNAGDSVSSAAQNWVLVGPRTIGGQLYDEYHHQTHILLVDHDMLATSTIS